MANSLMFEVGIKSAQEQLDKIKKEFKEANGELTKLLKIQVQIDGVDAITKALIQIGDNKQLQNLRQELEAINKEFILLSKGAGGVGDLNVRAIKQQMTEAEQAAKDYRDQMKKLESEQSRLPGGKYSPHYKGYTEEIAKLQTQIDGAEARIQKFKDQLANVGTNGTSGLNNVGASVDELKGKIDRLEAAIGGLNKNDIASTTKQTAAALEGEGGAVSEAISRFNELINEKAQVVKAEKQLAEDSKTAANAMGDEGKQANQAADALNAKKKAEKDAADASKQAADQQQGNIKNQIKLLFDIENKMASVGNILAQSGNLGLNPSLVNKAYNELEKLRNLFYDGKGFGKENFLPLSDKEISQLSQSFGLLKSQYKDIISSAENYNNSQAQGAKAAENSFNGVASKIADVTIRLDKYKTALDGAANTPISTTALDTEKAKVEELLRLLEQIKSNKGLTNDGRTMKQVMQEYGQYIKKADYAMSNLNKQVREHQKNAGKDQATEALKEQLRVIRMIRSLNKTANTAEQLGLDANQVRQMITLLDRYRQELQQIHDTGSGLNGRNLLQAQAAWGGTFMSADNANSALQGEIAKKKLENAAATSQLTAEEQKFAQALNHSTGEMKNQSQILSDMKTIAMQYISVWGAQNFVNKIIETGGQLEQQRLSLSAILGDMEKANTLFGQVKELALKSPFGVVQIDQMTKQLAAYSFEYKELFDWTTRLADISAATGTSVDRLALALGHVRNEGALSGYTLRQFAMANVPVLKMLSENLGISTKEVRERVRKKEISAEDVQDILKQLTDEGGMFYHAQEIMSQALNAKFKNLRDAFDIMYGEIAEGGVGDKLKELATILTQGAKEWERFGKDILMVGSAFAVGKVALALYNTALGQNTASTLKSIAAAQQKENAHYRLARAAGIVTKAEYKQLIYNERYSASGLKVALTTKKLTIEELQRAVALGKVNKAVAEAAVVSAGYDAALIKNVQVLGLWRKGIFLLGEGFRAAGAAVKGFLAAAWPLLALSVVFDLANRTSQNNDAAKEAAAGAAKATNKYQDLQAMTERLGTSQNKTNEQLENNIKAMKESLIACNEYTEELKKQVDSVESLSEKYDILYSAMKKVSDKASDKQSRKAALIEEGLSTGSGTAWNPINWFRDNALKDAKDIDDYTQDLYLVLDKNDKVLREGFKKILSTTNEWKAKFDAMSAKDIFMSLSEKLQDDVLYSLRWGKGTTAGMKKAGEDLAYSLYGASQSELKDAIGYSYKGAFEELRGHKKELAKAFEDAFRVDYPDIDLSKANEEQKIIFAKWLDETIANLENVKEAGKKALNDIIIEGTITVRPKYSLDNENFADFLREFQEKNPLAYYEWNKHGRDARASVEDQKKSAESYGKTFSGTTDSTLGNAAKKQRKELREERARLVAEQKSDAYKEDKLVKERVDNRIKEIDRETERLKQAQKDFNQYGDPDKSKGKTEDPNAKAVRERVRIIKEAADAYQYWKDKVGKEKAWAHVEDEFGDVLNDIKVTANNIEDLKGNLDKTLDMDEFKAIKDLKVQREIKKEIAKEKDQIKRKDYEKEAEEFTSKVKLELDSLTRAWEIFNNVRAATGNVELAIELSGANYAGGNNRNMADALRDKIQKDFDAAGGSIEFNVDFDDKQIEEKIKDAVPQATETQIKGLVEEYKKWRDLQRDVLKNDIATYTKLIGSSVDYESQLKKIISEMDILIEANDALRGKPGISDEDIDRANEVARLQAYEKAFKATNGYASLMNNSLAMTRDMFLTGINTQMSILEEKLRLNQISAHDFAEEMAKIRKMQEEFNNKGLFGKDNPFTAYLGGGLPNLKKWLESNVKQAEQDFKDTSLSPEQRRQAAQNFNKYNSLLESVNKVTSSLSSLAVVVEISKGVMDGFQQAAQSLSDMFDALGKSDAANTWSDIADTISAISSTLNGSSNVLQNAMSGNVGGTIASVISAPIETITAPITAFARLHDKKRERQIEELKNEVSKIDNTLNLIKNLRDRELGYDSGNLRRQLAAQYKAQKSTREINTIAGVISVDANKSATAMYDYYSRGGLEGNGYQQELEALKKQREDYQEMYDLEEDKKKSSSEALEEYKQKMAELDITIMNYAKDLANELYGIDLKGWADQIGDSLMTAFENGEDAAKAFKDTVQDIMRQVLRKMLSLGIIQPMMERLQKKLFGENGQGGVFDATNPEGTIDAAMKEVAAFFGDGGEGQAMIKATQTFYEKWEDLMRSQGLDLSKESSSSTGSSIKSITEQTADILSGYVNSIRADLSVNRAMIAQYFPMYYSAMTSGNASLINIENHTAAIMRSNDAIRESNAEVRDILKRVTQGGDKVRVS